MKVRIGGRMMRIKATPLGQISGSGDLGRMNSNKKNRRACKCRAKAVNKSKKDPRIKAPEVKKQVLNKNKKNSKQKVNRDRLGFRSY